MKKKANYLLPLILVIIFCVVYTSFSAESKDADLIQNEVAPIYVCGESSVLPTNTVFVTTEENAPIKNSTIVNDIIANNEVELEDAIEYLAILIYQEAGGDACCDDCRMRVADIALTRVKDSRYPDTLYGVMTQKGQYGRLYWTGICWPKRAVYDCEKHAVERAYEVARRVMSGEHSDLWEDGYIYQAEFPQGNDIVYCENCKIYYGR